MRYKYLNVRGNIIQFIYMDIPVKTAEEGIFLAKVAEQAERYEDMLTFLKPVIKKTSELTMDERNLVSVAYKNISGNKRTAWRALTAIEENPKYDKFHEKTKSYKVKVEEELKKICKEAIGAVDESLLKNASNAEGKVFYLKMKADYYRYMGEVCSGPELEEVSKNALECYEKAKKEAEALPATDPVRIGLILNFSVFQYEIRKNPKEACTMAKAAFDEAINGLEGLDEEKSKDSTAILQLLKDNLTLWTSELAEEEGGEKKA
jgi:14-3-3 protein epsilon